MESLYDEVKKAISVLEKVDDMIDKMPTSPYRVDGFDDDIKYLKDQYIKLKETQRGQGNIHNLIRSAPDNSLIVVHGEATAAKLRNDYASVIARRDLKIKSADSFTTLLFKIKGHSFSKILYDASFLLIAVPTALNGILNNPEIKMHEIK